MKRHRHRSLAAAIVLTLLLTVATAASAQKSTVTFGIPWGLDVFQGTLLRLVDAYNEQSELYHVEIDTGWSPEKLLTAAAAGTGPDVVGVDGPDEVRNTGEVVLQPIDIMIDRYDIDVSRFLPDSVTQIRGQTYAIKLFVDPNFPIVYNETLLQQAGLSEPPRTIQEFDEIYPKLLRRSNDGMLEQAGMLPWNLSEGHLFQTWGPVFGADRIWEGDETSGRYNVTTPEWRATFEWLNDYYQRISPDIAHWGDRRWYHLDWLIEGKLLMAYHVSPTLRTLQETTPYTWKIALPMTQPGGAEMPIWFGGFSFGVGKYAENLEGAYDFLRFITWDDRAAEIIGTTGLIGAYQGSVAHEVLLEHNPVWAEFIGLLPKASGNFYNPPQIRFADLSAEFVRSWKEGGSVPNGLAELERLLNSLAAEAGVLAQ